MPSSQPQVSAPPARHLPREAFAPSRETTLWWLTNAGFLINSRGTTLMLDPVIAYQPDRPGWSETGMRLLVSLPVEASQVPRLDAALYTHSDGDHFAPDTARALISAGARFVGPPPVARALSDLGLAADRMHVAVAGEAIEVGEAVVTPTPADHPWQQRDPARFGTPFGPADCCGYLIDTPDGRIWCPGDTRLMDEHLLVEGVDVLLLDVSACDYHLGVESAARLANTLGTPHLIPYHFGTYDAPDETPYNGDPAVVAARLRNPERLHLLAPGEPFVLNR